MVRRYALSLLMALVSSGSVGAIQISDTERDSLRGIREVKIVVESLDADAEQCNISKEALELAAARPLVDAGIAVKPELPLYVYVRVTVLAMSDGSGCAANVEVSARTPADAKLPHTAEPVRVRVLLWEGSAIFTGPRYNFGQRINASVREKVDNFATKVKLANAP